MAPHSQTEYIEKSFVAIPELIERQANCHGHRTAWIVDSISLTFDPFKRYFQIYDTVTKSETN